MVGSRRSRAGFTLVELLITLVIAGILLGLAVPSMQDFLLSNRLTAAANTMLGDLQLARSEAIKRGTQAVVCTSADGAACSGTLLWHKGWMVFADLDNDRGWTPGTDALVRVQEGFSEDMFTTAGPGDDRIVFTRQGLLEEKPGTDPPEYFGKGTYRVCNLKLNEFRAVEVQGTGRTSITAAQSCF